MKIAILGSSSQIAQSIIPYIEDVARVYQFSRSKNNLKLFPKEKYDMIINLIGVSKPVDQKKGGSLAVEVEADDMATRYIENHAKCLYVHMSSGVVYTDDHSEYAEAKRYVEDLHRKLPYNIVDVRLFSFFSRNADLNSGFLLPYIIKCIREGITLTVDQHDFMRDYIHPMDLAGLIMNIKPDNKAIDAYSSHPAKKFQILHYFAKEHGLEFDVIDDLKESSPTGRKHNYYPKNKHDFIPQYSSMETIKQESIYLL